MPKLWRARASSGKAWEKSWSVLRTVLSRKEAIRGELHGVSSPPPPRRTDLRHGHGELPSWLLASFHINRPSPSARFQAGSGIRFEQPLNAC